VAVSAMPIIQAANDGEGVVDWWISINIVTGSIVCEMQSAGI